jgi:hypothetical protein
MATYTALRAVHETLTAATVDTVQLTQSWDAIKIVNHGADPIYVSQTDDTISPGDPDTDVVPPHRTVLYAYSPNLTTPFHELHLVSAGANKYGVVGVRGSKVATTDDPTVTVGDLDSGAAASGTVLTANGSGGASYIIPMSGPRVVAWDTFDRADSTSLGVANSGQTWQRSAATANGIANGRLYFNSTGSGGTFAAGVDVGVKDVRVSGWLRRTVDGWPSLAGRMSDPTSTTADVVAARVARVGAPQEVSVVGHAGAGFTVWGTASIPAALAAVDQWMHMELILVGSYCRVTVNGVPILTLTLPAGPDVLTGTSAGFRHASGSLGAGQNIELDNFRVEALR